MKKIYFTIHLALIFNYINCQTTFTMVSPANTGFSSDLRTPNTTTSYAFQRSCFFIHRYELLPMSNTTINSISFQVINGTGSVPVTGNFTLYLQNTTDVQLLKSTIFNTIISPMTPAYVGSMTIPSSTGPATITLNLTTPFNYTGKGLYIAYNWNNSGPFATVTSSFVGSSNISALGFISVMPWMYSANSSNSAPQTLTGVSGFRPSLIFGTTNAVSNDVEVLDLWAQGKILTAFNTQTVYSRIANTSMS